MNRNLPFLLTATTASLLTFTVLAQNNTLDPAKPDRPGYSRGRADPTRADQLHGAAKASDIVGMTVKNYQDEKLGTVEELAVDLESGRILQVILSTGGFIGVGDRLSAVPPGALHHDVTNKVLHLDANKEKLQGAPEFNASKWPESFDSNHLAAVYDHYGQESAFRFIHNGNAIDGRSNVATTRPVDGTRSGDGLSGDTQWMVPASRLGQIQKATKLIGLLVKNQQDETIGKVDNMLVDVQSGRIVAVVVSSGGFLGMGDALSPVPPTALSFNAGRDTLQLHTSKESLSNSPHFKSDQWPDFNQPAYSESVYRAYKAKAYFSTNTVTDTDTVKDADNTARNVRDRGNRTLTPLDQGNSKADIDTTAQIRKGILAGKDMSVNARNVKIITNNGHVTLRGPVKSAEEKRIIGEIADRIARPENVDNQLEVTLETTAN